MAFRLASFLDRNGLLLTGLALGGGVARRVHNAMLRRAAPGRPPLRIHPTAHIRGLAHIRLGANFTAGRHLWLEAVEEQNGVRFTPELTIGRNVIVNDDVHIAAAWRVTIGDDVLIASRVFISDHAHGAYGAEGGSSPDTPPRLRVLAGSGPITIEDNVWIGEMVSVLPGVAIGRGSVIGAGSVVTRDIPPACVAVGAPARVIKRYDFQNDVWQSV